MDLERRKRQAEAYRLQVLGEQRGITVPRRSLTPALACFLVLAMSQELLR